MNYQRIHDAIIARAMNRVYIKGIHHNHHIIPLHEDSTSTAVVALTPKEHGIVHMCRYKMFNSMPNKIAGMLILSWESSMASVAGKIGGAKTKNSKSGIFADDWDRSFETSRRWKEGIINKSQFNDYAHCSDAGKFARDNKLGIFADDWDRSEQSKKYWNELPDDVRGERLVEMREYMRRASKRSVELGTNFTSWDPEKHKQVAKMGAYASLAKDPIWTNGYENKRFLDCPGEGWRRGFTKKKNLKHYDGEN